MTRRPDAGDCAARIGGPPNWTPRACPYGPGQWLVGETAEVALAVIAPGVPAQRAETGEQRLRWRVVSWALSAESAGADATEADMQVAPVAVVEALSLLGPAHATWVRDVCAGQLRHFESYATTLSGQPHEDRARGAAVPVARLRDELDAAFPGEEWHQSPDTVEEAIPDTAAAFLRSVDGPPEARADRLFELFKTSFYAAVDRYREARRRGRQLLNAVRSVPVPDERQASPCPPAAQHDDDEREAFLGA